MTQFTDQQIWEEFQGCFWAYIRPDGASFDDNRTPTLIEYCELTAQQILDFYTEPYDFAAIISEAVKVNDPSFLLGLDEVTLADESSRQALRDKAASSKPLFQTQLNHPVNQILNDLLQTEKGCRFYVQVACILADAANDEEFAPHLYGYKPGNE